MRDDILCVLLKSVCCFKRYFANRHTQKGNDMIACPSWWRATLLFWNPTQLRGFLLTSGHTFCFDVRGVCASGHLSAGCQPPTPTPPRIPPAARCWIHQPWNPYPPPPRPPTEPQAVGALSKKEIRPTFIIFILKLEAEQLPVWLNKRNYFQLVVCFF